MSENREYEDEELVVVHQEDEWSVAETPVRIETSGLGPCFGIIIYDPDSKQAIVGHFVDPLCQSGFNEMLDEAVRRFPNRSNLRIYIGGDRAEYPSGRISSHQQNRRNFVTQSFERYGFQRSQMAIQYQKYNHTTVLGIDTKTGEVEFSEEESDDADQEY